MYQPRRQPPCRTKPSGGLWSKINLPKVRFGQPTASPTTSHNFVVLPYKAGAGLQPTWTVLWNTLATLSCTVLERALDRALNKSPLCPFTPGPFRTFSMLTRAASLSCQVLLYRARTVYSPSASISASASLASAGGMGSGAGRSDGKPGGRCSAGHTRRRRILHASASQQLITCS